MPLTQFEERWPLPTESLPELPYNLKIVFLVECLSSENPVHVDHASAVKKRDHQSSWVDFLSLAFLVSGRASMLPLGPQSLGPWVIALDPAFITFEPEIIKISQSSHKMYTNKILNFQESTRNLNSCTKKSGNLLILSCVGVHV